MNPVVTQLILKELRVNRGFMAMAMGAALVSLVLASLGRVGFALGGILFISASLGSGIIVGMYGIAQERRQHANLFSASLPVSPLGVIAAKFIGALLVFGIPWLLLTAMGIGFVLLSDAMPDGLAVYALVIQCFIFAMIVLLYTMLLAVKSEVGSGFGVFAINILFSLFMVAINQRTISVHLTGPSVEWSREALGLLALDAGIVGLALLFFFVVLSRRRSFL